MGKVIILCMWYLNAAIHFLCIWSNSYFDIMLKKYNLFTDMLPQHIVYKNELNREYVKNLGKNDETPWWWSEKIETCRTGFKCFKVF